MIALYIITTFVIGVLIWLGFRRRWKPFMWVIVSLAVVVIMGWYLFIYIVSEAFGPKCEENRVWKIENYEIVEKRCIGFAGPYYYPVYLYEGNKEIDRLLFIEDSSCMVNFTTEAGDTLKFDICEMKLK